MAEVGEEANVSGRCAQKESNGIIRIMRDRETVDNHIADLEGRARRENSAIESCLHLRLDGFTGQSIAIERCIDLPPEAGQTLNVIRVFMGQKDSMEALGSSPNRSEALPDLAPAESGVDEQSRLVGLDVRAVSARTASQNG